MYLDEDGTPIAARARFDEAEHWIRKDVGAARALLESDRGWRLRIELMDSEGFCELYEERVFPERVLRADAHAKLGERGRVGLNLDEARWLRSSLDEVIAELEKRCG